MSQRGLIPEEPRERPRSNGASQPDAAQCPIGGSSLPHETEHLLADVIEFLPDATFVIDVQKRVVAWNRACELLAGVGKEALIGRGDHAYAEPFYGERRPILIDLLDSSDAELDAKYSNVRRKGNVIYADAFAPRLREGKGAYLSGEATALFDRAGRRRGAIESIRDVTEQKRAEAELLQREATIHSILCAAPIGICIMKDRRYISANRYWCEEFGYSEEALIGSTTRISYESEAEWQRVGHELYSSLGERSRTSVRTRLRRADGELREVIVTAARIHQADPASATIAIIHDITEHYRAEAALHLRNVILSTQQEASHGGTLVVSNEGRIISHNRKFQEMWRIPPEILQTASDERALEWAMTQVQDPERFIRGARELYAHPERSDQYEFAMHDGRTFERYSAPMIADDGTSLGRVWYFTDITARKQAELERDKAKQELWRSQKMDAIGSLAGGVAHDFNNLLSVIMAFNGFAQEQVHAGDPLMADLLEVQKAAERAATLTRQLLAFGRKQVLHPTPLNLNDVVKGLENMLQRILGEDIDLVFILAQDLGLTRVDPSQIEQVVMNLFVNARDAMRTGGTLTVETSNIALSAESHPDAEAMPPGHYVQLSVSDTGCGMDDQTISRIFEPFFTTKETGKGTGLGLSTAYGIVKQSGGDISVTSQLNHGTTFRIRLPRELSLSVKPTCHAPPAQRSFRGTETILVVDDEHALRSVARRALAEAGYNVLVAANGDEAIGLCSRHLEQIHLLLTDVVMPGMNGPALARELSRTRTSIKVLYMSGYANSAFDHAQLEAGSRFVSKPFTAAEITRKVRDVLDGRDI